MNDFKRSTAKPKVRTENILVRLSAKLKYVVELAARLDKTSQARIIEQAIEDLIDDPNGPLMLQRRDEAEPHNVFKETWNVDFYQRFINLAADFPGLLLPEEEAIWQTINARPADFFHQDGEDEDGYPRYTYVDADKVRARWEELEQRAKLITTR